MWLAAGLLVASIAVQGVPALPAPDGDPSRLRPGLFLYAAPGLPESRFAETVILLVEHGPEGSMGVVVNRPTERTTRDALDLEAAGDADLPLYWGGPVQPETVLALVRSRRRGRGARTVLPGVHLTGDAAEVQKALEREDRDAVLRVYSGYAGWGKGQLPDEVRARVWVLDRADARSVFSTEPDRLWRRVFSILRRLEAALSPGTEPRGR